jgi:hypothetical protein
VVNEALMTSETVRDEAHQLLADLAGDLSAAHRGGSRELRLATAYDEIAMWARLGTSEAVARARQRGHSWLTIARAFGLGSAQAAQQRWGRTS